MKVFLGIHVGHNASAALMVNGEIKFALQEERFTNQKNFMGFPEKSLKYQKNLYKVSDFQKSERDFAFIINKDFKSRELIEIISELDRDLIRDVNIFDVYEGENIPNDKKSVALNVTIQSMNKTLKDSDLDNINKLIIDTVQNKTGAKIRS